jgi:hypothetical protein
MSTLMNIVVEIRQDICLPSGRLSYCQEVLCAADLGIKTCRFNGDRL